ncbi:ribonuclease H-like domain-containing protein [Tanacetum coccineum]
MAREAEVKRVVNTGNGVTKPVWTNANRINHSNNFVPRSVQLNTCRPKFNSVRPNINTGRTNISSGRPKVNSAQMAHTNAVMGSWGSAVKTSASYDWRDTRPNFNYNSGPFFIRTEHPLKNMVDRGIFDSGCSGHMTGNKDQLEDFEEFNGGSVTFGGSKGYISGKGRIRVGNLDFDSVSFVKELGHFNLFSISQICDKQHKVLFTETECLVVSSDFKMPDENQILLKVPRHHNMYSFDMKTPSPAKGFACLIAKATSDESKLWHRRLGHINFKNLNKLVKGNLVRGLPSKVYNLVTKRVEVNLHVNFLEEKPNVKGVGLEGMFDIDYLTDSMNYISCIIVRIKLSMPGISRKLTVSSSMLLRKKMSEVVIIVFSFTVKFPEEKELIKEHTSQKFKSRGDLTNPNRDEDPPTNPKIQLLRKLEEICPKSI